MKTKKVSGSEAVILSLLAEGVDTIFGYPGGAIMPIYDLLYDYQDKITHILTRHEQAAGFMAATYGRLTGKPGVCLATLGPGATNFVTSVAYAFLGGMPCMFITGQKPIKTSKQGRFQIINVISMMDPITKMTRQIISADSIATLKIPAYGYGIRYEYGLFYQQLIKSQKVRSFL